MRKKLVKHGNSLALVIDKPILELHGIDADSELELVSDGKRLTFGPVAKFVESVSGATPVQADDEFAAILRRQNAEHAEMFRNLAKGAT